MSEDGQNLIGRLWQPARGGGTFASINPARRRDRIGLFPRSTSEDVAAAVEAARAASPGWSRRPAPARGDVLFRLADRVEASREAFAQLVTLETGKTIGESRTEVQGCVNTIRYWAGEGRRLYGETTPSEVEGKFVMTVRCPVGPAAIIAAWNVPMVLFAQKVAPAILAGNTVVYKPAEDAPAVATRLVQLLVDAGLPAGVVNLVHGYGEEVGAALVLHPDIRLISFTGSTEVGREIAERAGRGLKRVSLEMGGKNAFVVLEDADMELALREAIRSAFLTSGQRCSSGSRFLVHRSAFDHFRSQFVERVRALRVGDGLEEETDVGPLINEAQLRRVHRYTEIGKQEGAEVLVGGRVLDSGKHAEGFFYAPTVFGNVAANMRIAREEIFGPTALLTVVDDFEEAIAIANDSEYGLVASIFTRDVDRALCAIAALEVGVVAINRGTPGTEHHLPFGGVKASGMGRREGGGVGSLETFTEWKTVMIEYAAERSERGMQAQESLAPSKGAT